MARDWGLSLLQFLLNHSWIYGHPGYLHMYFPFKFSKSISIINSLAPQTCWCISINEPKPHVLNTDFKNEKEGLSKMHFHYFYLAYFFVHFFSSQLPPLAKSVPLFLIFYNCLISLHTFSICEKSFISLSIFTLLIFFIHPSLLWFISKLMKSR